MQVRLLGPVDVTLEGAAREVPGLRRKAILAALALKPGEVLSTDWLLDIGWGSRRRGPDPSGHRAPKGARGASRGRGEPAALFPELGPRPRQYPFQERLHGPLMLALSRARRQHDALAVYQRLAAHLDEEL